MKERRTNMENSTKISNVYLPREKKKKQKKPNWEFEGKAVLKKVTVQHFLKLLKKNPHILERATSC